MMRSLLFIGFIGAISGCLCVLAGTAVADEPPPPQAAPPPAAAPVTATTDPALQATATNQKVVTSTTTVTSAEEPSYVRREEKKCGLVYTSCRGPHLAVALEAGASSFEESGPFGFDHGLGSVSGAGPSWGVRVGIEALEWLALDAHYSGMSNPVHGAGAPGGSVGLLTKALSGELRLMAPLPYVQPYFFAGAGVYNTSVTGRAAAQAASPLYGSSQLGVPIGVGFQVPIWHGISAGAEGTYHRFFGEQFAESQALNGGDLTTFNAIIRARL